MVNIEEFTKRLEELFSYYELTASTFADKIGVQRSSLSHLLSGRNKPSLDFVLKVTTVFPEIDLYWLLLGKGNFLEEPKLPTQISNPQKPLDLFAADQLESEVNTTVQNTVPSPKDPPMEQVPITGSHPLPVSNTTSEVERIVFFYKNGSFKEYHP